MIAYAIYFTFLKIDIMNLIFFGRIFEQMSQRSSTSHLLESEEYYR